MKGAKHRWASSTHSRRMSRPDMLMQGRPPRGVFRSEVANSPTRERCADGACRYFGSMILKLRPTGKSEPGRAVPPNIRGRFRRFGVQSAGGHFDSRKRGLGFVSNTNDPQTSFSAIRFEVPSNSRFPDLACPPPRTNDKKTPGWSTQSAVIRRYPQMLLITLFLRQIRVSEVTLACAWSSVTAQERMKSRRFAYVYKLRKAPARLKRVSGCPLNRRGTRSHRFMNGPATIPAAQLRCRGCDPTGPVGCVRVASAAVSCCSKSDAVINERVVTQRSRSHRICAGARTQLFSAHARYISQQVAADFRAQCPTLSGMYPCRPSLGKWGNAAPTNRRWRTIHGIGRK